MDRRTFNKLAGLAAATPFTGKVAQSENNPGTGTPAHDADFHTPLAAKKITLENESVRVSFDARTGALTELVVKKRGWEIQKFPELGESFVLFAPTAERSDNPTLGARNRVSSITKDLNGESLTIIWSGLESEFSGHLDITLTGVVTLDGAGVNFDLTVRNGSKHTIASVAWPIVGALGLPPGSAAMRRFNTGFTLGHESPIYPRFSNEHEYCGVNWPTQIGEGCYNLFLSEADGLYVGTHDTRQLDTTRYFVELKPGYSDSRDALVPTGTQIDGHRVQITVSSQHFVFTAPGETFRISRIRLEPFQGNWHQGADIYRRWFNTWFKRPVQPAWLSETQLWYNLQFNSAEDSLRTSFKDLPRRVLQAAKAGVTAVQLIGWNDGGQDRNNPCHDPDPRLGTRQEFKDAIARIEAMGVHVVLFVKFTWNDITTKRYREELHKYDVLDANGTPYYFRGYRYDTPEQMADMNVRRFAVACGNSEGWQRICREQFGKVLEYGGSGMLYDEVNHHGGADFCFAADHGHRLPVSTWSQDSKLGSMFRIEVAQSRGEAKYLMAGEGLYDQEKLYYSMTYTRVNETYWPVMRYHDPQHEMLVAVTGFDDRCTINTCLQYRFIIGLEPFNFKGDVDDYPLTVAYARKMAAFRTKYREWLWDAEFRDNQDATVLLSGRRYERFSVFLRADGKRSAAVVNTGAQAATVHVQFHGAPSGALAWTSPDDPSLHSATGEVPIAARSAVVVLEE
jgi:hypothetical protein